MPSSVSDFYSGSRVKWVHPGYHGPGLFGVVYLVTRNSVCVIWDGGAENELTHVVSEHCLSVVKNQLSFGDL